MKKATQKAATVNHKRGSSWAKITPLSRIPKAHAKITHHVGTAY